MVATYSKMPPGYPYDSSACLHTKTVDFKLIHMVSSLSLLPCVSRVLLCPHLKVCEVFCPGMFADPDKGKEI